MTPLTDEQSALAASCYPLAISLANRFVHSWHDGYKYRDDAVSLACQSLVVAARGFKPELGYKFSTYCQTAITRDLYGREEGLRAMIARDRDQAFSELQRRDRHFDIADEAQEPEFLFDELSALHSAVESLSSKDRRLIEDWAFNGANMSEIAKREGVVKQAIGLRIKAAIDRLKKNLHGEPPDARAGYRATSAFTGDEMQRWIDANRTSDGDGGNLRRDYVKAFSDVERRLVVAVGKGGLVIGRDLHVVSGDSLIYCRGILTNLKDRGILTASVFGYALAEEVAKIIRRGGRLTWSPSYDGDSAGVFAFSDADRQMLIALGKTSGLTRKGLVEAAGIHEYKSLTLITNLIARRAVFKTGEGYVLNPRLEGMIEPMPPAGPDANRSGGDLLNQPGDL